MEFSVLKFLKIGTGGYLDEQLAGFLGVWLLLVVQLDLHDLVVDFSCSIQQVAAKVTVTYKVVVPKLETERKDKCCCLYQYLNEWCFRPQFCTCRAILGQRQPRLMR